MATIANMNVALSMDDSDFSAGIARAQGSAESFSKKLGSLGQTMSLAVTAPLVGIAAAAVASAGKFEQSMNVMGQVTGATASEMATLQAQALELGAVTSFSAGEAADAMLELGKAGLAPSEIGGAIAGTMDLAAAGSLDLATAATITANALNAFKLPAEEASDVANLFAAAANASSVDVSDLAMGVQNAGAVFSSNGQSVTDLTAALAILGNNAISGSDAGTSLKTMLLALAAPTDEAAGVMADLGIQVFNADGSMRGFGDIVGNLEASTNDLSDAERNMALKTIFGSDAIRAATILAGEGADGFAEMTKAVTKEGAAAATANARMKGIGGAIEYLKGSIDSFLINAALPFLDTLSGLVRGAADFLTTIGELPEPVRNTAIAIGAVLAAAGPVLLIISKIIPLFGTLSTVLGVLTGPIGLVAVGVAALGVAWTTNFGNIQGITAGVISSLGDLWSAIEWIWAGDAENIDWWYDIVTAWGLTGDTADDISEALFNVGVSIGNVIEGFKAFGSYIAAVIIDGDTLNDWLTHLPEGIQPVALALGELIANLTSDASLADKIATLQTDIGALFDSITALDWGGAWGAFQTWLDGWAAAVVSEVQKIDWGGAAETAGNMFDVLANVVVYHLKKIPWSDIIGTAGDLFWQLTGAITTAWEAIPWETIIAADAAFSKTLGDAVAARFDSAEIDAAILAADAAFSEKMQGMVDGFAADIKEKDFTPATVAWLDKVSTSLGEADWSGMGTTLATQFNAAFADTESSAFDFSSLDQAMADAVAGMDWAKVKEKLAAIDTVFAEGLGEFGEAFSGTFEAPEWMQKFIDWTMPPPDEWMDAFLAWVIKPPEFMDAFLSWTIAKPDWMDDFLGWFPEMPGWVGQLLGWRPPAAAGAGNPYVAPNPNAYIPPKALPLGGLSPWLPSGGVNTPSPNNGSLPNTDISGSSFGGNSPTGMGGSIIGAVYVNNSVDVNEIAYKVAQANQRRYA